MQIDAPAKLNLFLHVTGKRPDGYHLLESLMVFASIADTISVEPAKQLSLTITGEGSETLQAEEDNIILRAARILAEHLGKKPECHLTLHKRIPIGAGLGGGSADAAATLRLLCRFWEISPDKKVLEDIALSLGADVPFCLNGRAGLVSGVGEKIAPMDALPEIWAVLVNPRIALSTQRVFKRGVKAFTPAGIESIPHWNDAGEAIAWLSKQHNDLETPAIACVPEIAGLLKLLQQQKGCELARMSGSGATCFGLFSEHAQAHEIADKIAVQYPDWWVSVSPLVSGAFS